MEPTAAYIHFLSPISLFFLQVEEVELIDKKGYLTLSISLAKDGKILLRKPEGIRDWFEDIKVRDVCVWMYLRATKHE